LAQTAAAVRTLADYLERHPVALVRGKPENKRKRLGWASS
jgi:paraquat-inducible protein B